MSAAARREVLYDVPSPTEDKDVEELIQRQRGRDKIARGERRRERRQARIQLVKSLTALAVESDVWTCEKPRRLANPDALSLVGYGMTIILMCLAATGHWEYYAVSIGMSIVFGGGTQVIGGCLAYIRGETFPWTFFTLNGCFWLSIVGIFALPRKESGGSPILHTETRYFFGVYFCLWTIVSFVFVGCALKMNVNMLLITATQFLAYLLITIGLMGDVESCYYAAGYCGVVSGGLAMYLGYAQTLNEVFDRSVFPVLYYSHLKALYNHLRHRFGSTEDNK